MKETEFNNSNTSRRHDKTGQNISLVLPQLLKHY